MIYFCSFVVCRAASKRTLSFIEKRLKTDAVPHMRTLVATTDAKLFVDATDVARLVVVGVTSLNVTDRFTQLARLWTIQRLATMIGFPGLADRLRYAVGERRPACSVVVRATDVSGWILLPTAYHDATQIARIDRNVRLSVRILKFKNYCRIKRTSAARFSKAVFASSEEITRFSFLISFLSRLFVTTSFVTVVTRGDDAIGCAAVKIADICDD